MLTQADLSQFTGSDTFTKYMGGTVLSEGARYVADQAAAYWLMDIIWSWQTDPKVRAEEFQVWKLKADGDVEKMRPAVVTCDDGNGNVIATQVIRATDFPLTTVTLWFQNGVIFLPSEY